MTYEEIKNDLFQAPTDCYLVHCISADFKMGAGIAKQFAQKGVRNYLCVTHPIYKWNDTGYAVFAPIATHKGVINLVTKSKYFNKPTYDTLKEALLDSKTIIRDGDSLAMPLIGCGLDKLEWTKVKDIILDVFKNDDIHITVYKL
jgi:Macro domain.